MTPKQFRQARHKLGLSVAEMAALLGVTDISLRRLEMDPGHPASRQATDTMSRLLAAYLEGYRPPDWPHRKGTA